jgi:hypothetical protein
MNAPGFTAETSLYKSNKSYRAAKFSHANGGVHPSLELPEVLSPPHFPHRVCYFVRVYDLVHGLPYPRIVPVCRWVYD